MTAAVLQNGPAPFKLTPAQLGRAERHAVAEDLAALYGTYRQNKPHVRRLQREVPELRVAHPFTVYMGLSLWGLGAVLRDADAGGGAQQEGTAPFGCQAPAWAFVNMGAVRSHVYRAFDELDRLGWGRRFEQLRSVSHLTDGAMTEWTDAKAGGRVRRFANVWSVTYVTPRFVALVQGAQLERRAVRGQLATVQAGACGWVWRRLGAVRRTVARRTGRGGAPSGPRPGCASGRAQRPAAPGRKNGTPDAATRTHSNTQSNHSGKAGVAALGPTRAADCRPMGGGARLTPREVEAAPRGLSWHELDREALLSAAQRAGGVPAFVEDARRALARVRRTRSGRVVGCPIQTPADLYPDAWARQPWNWREIARHAAPVLAYAHRVVTRAGVARRDVRAAERRAERAAHARALAELRAACARGEDLGPWCDSGRASVRSAPRGGLLDAMAAHAAELRARGFRQ